MSSDASDFAKPLSAAVQQSVSVSVEPVSTGKLGYKQFVANASITATTEATANAIVTADPITFDGTTQVEISFFSPQAAAPGAAAMQAVIYLDGTSIGSIGAYAAGSSVPTVLSFVTTPSAGSHTYSVRAFVGSGTGVFAAGAGGLGATMPGFILITKI